MDIGDIEVFIGIDVGKSEHWATALSRDGQKVLDRALPNDEERLRALYKKLADHEGRPSSSGTKPALKAAAPADCQNPRHNPQSSLPRNPGLDQPSIPPSTLENHPPVTLLVVPGGPGLGQLLWA